MITLTDLLVVVAIAAATSGGVALLGGLLLRRLRTRSATASLAGVVCVALGAVVVGAVGTAWAMFLSVHDLRVLLVVVAVAGSVGLGAAVVLGRDVMAAGAALGRAGRGLSEEPYVGVGRPLPAELAALDRQLAETSARLRASRERERALESSRRELVAWVSHDLRTPLAGVRAMAEALVDGVVVEPEVVRRYHLSIQRETERLSGMVDDLFELSRINASALRLTLQDLSLADLVSDAVASAAPVAAAKGVRLLARAEQVPTIEASVPELSRVLRNLLSNAIRHTPADGVVHVAARGAGAVAEVEVTDACGGIPEQDLPRLFDVAFRGTSARTPGDDDGGAGLGLAIAKGLVEAHGGQIAIGNHGPGCRVLIRLPVTSPRSA